MPQDNFSRLITRSQTAQTRRPNVEKPPGFIGDNSLFQGYSFDRRVKHVTQLLPKMKYIILFKKKKIDKCKNIYKCIELKNYLCINIY